MSVKRSSSESIAVRLKPYKHMKDSGVEWLGEVPAHWDVRPLKHWLGINESVLPDDTDPDYLLEYLDIGSIGIGHLVALPERMSFRDAPSRARRIVSEGDTLVSTVRTYLKAVWHAESAKAGLIASTGFAVLTPRCGTWSKFVSYVCQSQPFTDGVMANSIGVAYPAIAETRLGSLPIAVPPLEEQALIARFLDHATSRIERYTRAKEKLIALLKEQKQVIVHDAVTGRIDVRTGKPYPAYKPSAIAGLGYIPEHWDVRSAKWHFREVDERSTTGCEELLSVSHITGITPRSEKNVTMFKAESNVGYKICRSGDVVINTMWAWMAALGLARQLGVVSPSYAVYRRTKHSSLSADYGELLLRSAPYRAEYKRLSTGIRPSRLRLYPDAFLRIGLICPLTGEQSAIVAFVQRNSADIGRASRLIGNEITALQEYQTRLIADVVTGKLDVREAAGALPEKPRSKCTAFDEVEGGDANQEEATKMTNWDTCPAVERKPGKVSGAWVFAGTRIPLSALYENLAGGATVDEFVEWFPGVDEQQVRTVLEHEAQTLRAELAR